MEGGYYFGCMYGCLVSFSVLVLTRDLVVVFSQRRCYFCCGASDCASWYEKHRRSSTKVALSAGPFTTSSFSPSSSTSPCEFPRLVTSKLMVSTLSR